MALDNVMNLSYPSWTGGQRYKDFPRYISLFAEKVQKQGAGTRADILGPIFSFFAYSPYCFRNATGRKREKRCRETGRKVRLNK